MHLGAQMKYIATSSCQLGGRSILVWCRYATSATCLCWAYRFRYVSTSTWGQLGWGLHCSDVDDDRSTFEVRCFSYYPEGLTLHLVGSATQWYSFWEFFFFFSTRATKLLLEKVFFPPAGGLLSIRKTLETAMDVRTYVHTYCTFVHTYIYTYSNTAVGLSLPLHHTDIYQPRNALAGFLRT